MSKPHVPCVRKRLAGRPTDGAGPSPPTSRRCKAPWLAIGQSLAPWIIGPRYGTQPDEQAACAFNLICMWKRLAFRPEGTISFSKPRPCRRPPMPPSDVPVWTGLASQSPAGRRLRRP